MSLSGNAMVARCKRRIKRGARIDLAQLRMEWANKEEAYERHCRLRATAEHKVRLALGMAGHDLYRLFPWQNLFVPQFLGNEVTGDE